VKKEARKATESVALLNVKATELYYIMYYTHQGGIILHFGRFGKVWRM